MGSLRSWFSISQLVTVGPIILLLILSLVLGGSRYLSAYHSELGHALTEARISAQPIINLMRVNVGGGNYANVQDGAALELYKADGRLMFFQVTGETNVNSEPYGLIYESVTGQVMRTIFSDQYVAALEETIEKANKTLESLPAEHRKRKVIEKILGQKQVELSKYQATRSQIEQSINLYSRPAAEEFVDGYYLDEHYWRLHLLIPLGGKIKGEVWMVLDAAELGGLGWRILKEVLPLNLATLVFCIFMAIMLSRVISNPLKRMEKEIGRIAQSSDLTMRIDEKGRDEIAKMGGSFNAMVEKFQSILATVISTTDEVASSSVGMMNSINTTAEGMQRQQQETEMLSSSANEMLAAVGEVASNASVAAQCATDANAQAVTGKAEVDSTVASISRLAVEVDQAMEAIAQLNEETITIGSVIDVIKGIAEQTNLLALNAAIEAARAGDQGRGFAVVADEVRTLAMKTQESTAEIENMIVSLQVGARETVGKMEAGKACSDECVQQARRAGEALGLITQAVEQISTMNTQIASAAEAQSAVTDQINGHICAIKEITDKNSSRATGCTDISKQLTALARDLEAKVRTFKV